MSLSLSLLFIIEITIFLIQSSLSQSSKCLQGKNFCKKCNIVTDLCIKCQNDLLIPDKKGGCKGAKTCSPGRHYCEECDEENCDVCLKGFFPDKNGGCSYTQNCKLSYNGHCLQCEEDYILLGDVNSFKICKYLGSDDYVNCKKINQINGECEACEEGFYLNSGDKKCIETKNCQESIYGKCVLCKTGYYLDIKNKNTCKQITANNTKTFNHCIESENGKKCSKCEKDYYYDLANKCVNTNYCNKSDENFLCEECLEDYYLSEDKYSCTDEPKCRNGDRDSGFCTWCIDGYYIDENERKCFSNQEDDDLKHCRAFKDECLVCETGFEVGKDGKCAGSKYCEKSNKSGRCKQCQEGFYLSEDYRCIRVEHCKKTNQYYSCEECSDGYQLNGFGFCIPKESDIYNFNRGNY